MKGWTDITIILMHYAPRSKGARVVVMKGDRHIVSLASREGMTVDDPNIQSFLAWATGYYEDVPFREMTREEACALEASRPQKRRGRPRRARDID